MSHPCKGNCGRQVSGNKHMCLDCQAKVGRAALAQQGVILSHEEVKRGIKTGRGDFHVLSGLVAIVSRGAK